MLLGATAAARASARPAARWAARTHAVRTLAVAAGAPLPPRVAAELEDAALAAARGVLHPSAGGPGASAAARAGKSLGELGFIKVRHAALRAWMRRPMRSWRWG